MVVGDIQGRGRALKGCRPSVLEHTPGHGWMQRKWVHALGSSLAGSRALPPSKFPSPVNTETWCSWRPCKTHSARKTVNPQTYTHTTRAGLAVNPQAYMHTHDIQAWAKISPDVNVGGGR